MKTSQIFLTALTALAGTTVAAPSPDSGVTGLARGMKDVCVQREPVEMEWETPLSFTNDVLATGKSTVVFSDNGNVRFRTQIRSTGDRDYKYVVSCALRDSEGHVYYINRKGEVFGAGSGRPREHTVDQTKRHPDIQKNWRHIVRRHQKLDCNSKVNVEERVVREQLIRRVERRGPTVGELITVYM